MAFTKTANLTGYTTPSTEDKEEQIKLKKTKDDGVTEKKNGHPKFLDKSLTKNFQEILQPPLQRKDDMVYCVALRGTRFL